MRGAERGTASETVDHMSSPAQGNDGKVKMELDGSKRIVRIAAGADPELVCGALAALAGSMQAETVRAIVMHSC